MAKCDQGYRCEVCGHDVEHITESDLYLRYVLGEVPMEKLHLLPERHIVCNPALAQYVVAEGFPPLICEGLFDRRLLPADYVEAEVRRVTAGWHRLQAIPTLGVSVAEYPIDNG